MLHDSNKPIAIITVTWKDYSEKFLPAWIKAVRGQDYGGEIKVFITDNETSPEIAGFIRQTAPEAELILNNTNDGFAKGMNDGLRQAISQGYEYALVLNIHTEMEPDCLREMAKVLESDKAIGIVQARQMMPDKKTINSLGNKTHFLGFGYSGACGQEWQGQAREPKPVFYASGTSMLFRAGELKRLGLFDEHYWMYNEDQELSWRFRLAGYEVMLAPKAVLYSAYDFKRSITKAYWMDRNRIIAILSNYRMMTLIFILPAFIMMEFGQILFAWKSGWLKDKFRVWLYFLKPSAWPHIFRARRRNRMLRAVSDRHIAKLISGRIEFQPIDDWKLKLANPFFDFYWRVVRWVIPW